MEMQHTPGPWAARELFEDGDEAQSMGLFIYEERNAYDHREPVASLPGIGREDFANAQLIAAAPDLLHALNLMLREHDALQIAEGSTEDRWPAATLARAVISKATGGNA